MLARIEPGAPVGGEANLPGDKSIAHRWLILAATARGTSYIRGLPPALDVSRTARALSTVAPSSASTLEGWADRAEVEGAVSEAPRESDASEVRVEGEGREALTEPSDRLDCGNSGTTMRLLAGVVAASPFRTVLTGDGSLLARPMERVAEPLRAMGARVETTGGTAPITVLGGGLRGVRWSPPVPSAQVKSAVLLAGVAAEGRTEVVESSATRDHTERALEALGGPVVRRGMVVTISGFQHDGFDGAVPGDISSAAFLLAAGALTGAEVDILGSGVNPTRTHVLTVLERMGASTSTETSSQALGEPVGQIHLGAVSALRGTTVAEHELPLVIDEVAILAMLAAHADGESRFEGAAELRVKESDRLTAIAEGIRDLGGEASVEEDALVVAGGGLAGGRTNARGDHRLAMAFVVGALAARGESEVMGVEWAAVSYPGFVPTLRSLGARIEVGR